MGAANAGCRSIMSTKCAAMLCRNPSTPRCTPGIASDCGRSDSPPSWALPRAWRADVCESPPGRRFKPSNAELIWLCEILYDAEIEIPEPLQRRGWVLDHLFFDDKFGLKAGLFKISQCSVIVVRGTKTNCMQNLVDDVLLFGGVEPWIVQPVMDALRHVLNHIEQDGSLHLTGHSLGASAINWAMLSLAKDECEPTLRKIGSIALFENPGVAQSFLAAVPPPVVSAVSEKTTEFFSAPNIINMWLTHMPCRKIRIMIPHGQVCDRYHVARCAFNSACRSWPIILPMLMLPVASVVGTVGGGVGAAMVGTGISLPALAVPSAVVEISAVAAAASIPTAASLAAGTFGFCLKDYVRWLWGQHNHQTLRGAFEVGADMPREYRLMKRWPNNISLLTASHTVMSAVIPRHRANHGLHTMQDPDSVVEAQIQMLEGYEEHRDGTHE